MARDRLRDEDELRAAEAVVAHLGGVSLDEAAQAIKDHAVLMHVSVVDVARAVITGRATISPTRRGRRSRPRSDSDQAAP